MSSPPSNIHYPITKQHRKPSFRNNPAPSKVNCKIKPGLIWHFDSPRKDAKRQARLRGIKFFYSLEVKLCNKDYHYLRCLKSDKPCCRYLIMKLDKPCLYTYDFPVRKHHMKLFKIEIGSKAHIDLTTKFWKRISPQITVFDYISNEIANFRQIITTSPAYQYRMLNNFGFPIVRNMSDLYQTVFNFVKNLRALKMLSFNTVSQINAVDASSILTSLNWLSHLRGLNLIFKGNNAICVDTISQALQNFQKLQFLSLQFGKITTRNNQELLLQKATMLTERLYAIRHLELEVYLENRYKEAFCLFLSGLENLKALISLDLKIDRGSSTFAESLDLPNVEESVFSRIKDLSLEGNKYGIGIDLAEYFLSKTKNLRACFLKNIELERSKKSSHNLAEVVLANENLKELKVLYEDAFDAEALETLFHGIKKLKNLQMFSVQLQSLEPIEFKLDDLISAILDLKKADTIVIEILYPIKINLAILNKLFDNIFKLKRLSALKLDLRLLNELKGSGVRKLFMLESLDILTVIIEGMKLTKEDQKFVKEHSKTMKRLNTCLLECEDFKVDRVF